MDPRNRELFGRVREKAHFEGQDAGMNRQLGDLADAVNEDERQKTHVGDFDFSNGKYQYFLIEWPGQAQAAVLRGQILPRKNPVYIVMHFSTDAQGIAEKLIGIYSTAAPQKEERFKDIMGYVKMDDFEAEGYVRSMLLETLDAKLG
jgi:hypothetical protein